MQNVISLSHMRAERLYQRDSVIADQRVAGPALHALMFEPALVAQRTTHRGVEIVAPLRAFD